MHLHAGDSASCWAPQQEQSRYSASAAPAMDFAWRCAPCSADHSFEPLTSARRCWTRHLAFADHVLHLSERCRPSRSALPPPVAASGGVLLGLDWPALTPALIEIRLFVFAECPSASSHGTPLNWDSRLFSSRRQAHFLLAKQTAFLLMPNVRAEVGPTAKRRARVVEHARAHFAGLAV